MGNHGTPFVNRATSARAGIVGRSNAGILMLISVSASEWMDSTWECSCRQRIVTEIVVVVVVVVPSLASGAYADGIRWRGPEMEAQAPHMRKILEGPGWRFEPP